MGIYASKVNENDKRNGWLFAGSADNINSTFKINNYALYFQLKNELTNNLYSPEKALQYQQLTHLEQSCIFFHHQHNAIKQYLLFCLDHTQLQLLCQ